MLPRQVFISYARADALTFATRLAADLERHGHRAWLDRNDIEKGGPFEVRIEQGIRAAEVVAAVMTCRSQEETSVCRDEVVFALNEDKRLVPLRLHPTVKPTLLLARRNWIDFTESYQTGLDALLSYLAGNETELRPPQLATVTGVRPLDFSLELAKFSAGFTGRQWLNPEIDRWLSTTSRRAFVIVADPGVGKSAIAAWLSRTRPEVAGFYFCTQQNSRSLNPHEFVACLVGQLHAAVTGFAEAVETRRPAERRRTAADAFRELIVEPAHTLPAPAGMRLLVVDALDEAATREGETVLDVLVKQAPDLPAWLRLVMTTRPEEPILRLVRNLNVFELTTTRTENRDDVRSFIDQRLGSAALRQRVGTTAAQVAATVETLAENNFLCARLALDALEDGTLAVADLSRLTPGLTVFYSALFARRFPDVTVYAVEYAALLKTLAAARGPMPLALLRRVCGAEEQVLHRRLLRLRPYLRVFGHGEKRYALFHKSLQDWLTDPDAAGDYWCPSSSGHAEIAAALGAEGRGDYGLRYLPAHLAGSGQWDRLAELLCEGEFLEAKAEAGLIFDLAMDFTEALRGMPADHPRRRLLALLEEALRRDLHFLARHPAALFQCLWNSGWWYDSAAAADHYDPPEDGWPAAGPPWLQPGLRLSSLLESWRASKESAADFRFVRSLRPPPHPLGTAQRAVFRGHEKPVVSVVFASDGRCFASGSRDGTIRVWDAASGVQVLRLDGHRDGVQCVAYSPDGRRLASASRDRTVRLWDSARGTELACLRGHLERVWCIAFSPDGRYLLSGGDDWTLRIWDIERAVEVRCCRLRGLSEQGAVLSVAFAPDGRHFLSGLADGTIRIWDTTGAVAPGRLLGHEGAVDGLAFTPDGSRFASTGAEGVVRTWDARTGAAVSQFEAGGYWIAGLAFSPDGRRLAGGCSDRSVRVWDVDRAIEVRCLRGHESRVREVAFSPDGRWLVSASDDRTVRLWDPSSGVDRGRLRDHAATIRVLAFAPDGRHLVSGAEDGDLRLWDAGRATLRGCLREGTDGGGTGPVLCLAFSREGSRVASGTKDGAVRVWEVPGGRELCCCRASGGAILSVAFAPDGRCLACGTWEGKIHVWDAVSGAERLCLRGHTDAVWRLVFSEDGERLVSGSADGTFRVWDVCGGACLAVNAGRGDREPVSANRVQSPWRVAVRGLETAIEAAAGEAAWFSTTPGLIQGHPSGRSWAGAVGNYLCLFALEGGRGRP